MPPIPLSNANSFNLDVSGIAGFFGGEEAFAAMSSVHLVRGRRWLGWYNSPGSYIVAKKYGVLARSRIWDGLFPGANVDPTRMLELDGKHGPKYLGIHSGTSIDQTGHLAFLLADYCGELPSDEKIEGTQPSETDQFLTVVELHDYPEDLRSSDGELPAVNLSPFDPIAVVPIAASIAGAVLCAIYRDWFSFSMIVLGILCNGASCAVIGSGVLKVKGPSPSPHSPPADGIFFATGGNGQVILLKGGEQIVSTLVRGKYYLQYSSQTKYHDIGISSLALTLQFLVQLFIIPQGKLFGQIMFLSTFAVSWVYNAYLASVDREALQKRILLSALLRQPKTWKIRVPKYTTVAVLLTMLSGSKDPRATFNSLLSNDTVVWNLAKDIIVESIESGQDPAYILNSRSDWSTITSLSQKEQSLLNDLTAFSSQAFHAVRKYRERLTPPLFSSASAGSTEK
ncbi:hypothetical protein CPC08DRAFT_709610 [Agrocybe pediades]|nr:hypothetical protein CPC08DRAFT_709610 [Agrocybe pediades]